MRLRSPRPLDCWRRQQENGGLNLVSFCSMDVKQSFDNVSPEYLSLVMKEMNIAPVLIEAILREQIGGKYDICFQETRISGIPFDKSIKQGGKESPCLFNLMMRNVFRALQEERKVLRMDVKTRNSVGPQEEDRVSHMIFADNCYLFAESKEQISKMIGYATEELRKRGLDWKEDQMKMTSWGFREEVGDLHIEAGGMIRGVEALKAMGALITWEADSMSGMKFRMNKADKALVTPNSLQQQIFNIFSSSSNKSLSCFSQLICTKPFQTQTRLTPIFKNS